MIQSVRDQQKKRKDFMGIVGILTIVLLVGGGFYWLNSVSDPLDENFCSAKNGPKAVTAIIFDKSEQYSRDQVTDIKTSFGLWLSGQEATTKNRDIDLGFFAEGTLVQLYVTDQEAINRPDGLDPKAQLCVPRDFRDAEGWIDNPDFLKADYQKFVSTFTNAIEELLQEAEGTSPIMETFVRISNSESFQAHPTKPHNMFIISDMLQNSDNYSHYRAGEGPNWNSFEEKMKGTVYLRPRLNGVKWQVFWAKREKIKDRSLQTPSLTQFWVNFFDKAKAEKLKWILIDG